MSTPHELIAAKDKQIAELRSANEKLTQRLKLLKMTAMQALEPIDLMVMSPAENRLYEMVKSFN